MHQFHRHHRAGAAHIADEAHAALLQGAQAALDRIADLHRALTQAVALDDLEHLQPRHAAQRRSAICAAQPAHVGRVHHFGAAHHARYRESARHRFGNRHDVGLHAARLVHPVHRKHAACARKARLHLVGHQQNAVPVADVAQGGEELVGSVVKPALAEHRLQHNRGHGGWLNRRGKHCLQRLNRLPLVKAVVGDRKPGVKHIGRHRAELCLIWQHLTRHCQGEQRAPVIAALKRDDPAPPGMRARHLHSILQRLCARGEKDRLHRPFDGRNRIQLLGQRDIGFVGRYLKRAMRKPVELRLHRRHNARITVASVAHRDPAGEIDVALPLGIKRLGIIAALKKALVGGGDAARHGGFAPRPKFSIGGHRKKSFKQQQNSSKSGAHARAWAAIAAPGWQGKSPRTPPPPAHSLCHRLTPPR